MDLHTLTQVTGKAKVVHIVKLQQVRIQPLKIPKARFKDKQEFQVVMQAWSSTSKEPTQLRGLKLSPNVLAVLSFSECFGCA